MPDRAWVSKSQRNTILLQFQGTCAQFGLLYLIEFFFLKRHVVCCWLNLNNGPQWSATRAKRLMFLIYDITTFLSLTLTSLFLRIPTAGTIIYVLVANIKKVPFLEAVRRLLVLKGAEC